MLALVRSLGAFCESCPQAGGRTRALTKRSRRALTETLECLVAKEECGRTDVVPPMWQVHPSRHSEALSVRQVLAYQWIASLLAQMPVFNVPPRNNCSTRVPDTMNCAFPLWPTPVRGGILAFLECGGFPQAGMTPLFQRRGVMNRCLSGAPLLPAPVGARYIVPSLRGIGFSQWLYSSRHGKAPAIPFNYKNSIIYLDSYLDLC